MINFEFLIYIKKKKILEKLRTQHWQCDSKHFRQSFSFMPSDSLKNFETYENNFCSTVVLGELAILPTEFL